jgi:hypothetical protein
MHKGCGARTYLASSSHAAAAATDSSREDAEESSRGEKPPKQNCKIAEVGARIVYLDEGGSIAPGPPNSEAVAGTLGAVGGTAARSRTGRDAKLDSMNDGTHTSCMGPERRSHGYAHTTNSQVGAVIAQHDE